MLTVKTVEGRAEFSGMLRPSEKKKIAEALAKRWPKTPTCELCGEQKWQLGDYIVTPAGLARHTARYLMRAPADPPHPSFMLLCGNCGNTKLLNAVILDAFDLRDDTDDLEPEAESVKHVRAY